MIVIDGIPQRDEEVGVYFGDACQRWITKHFVGSLVGREFRVGVMPVHVEVIIPPGGDYETVARGYFGSGKCAEDPSLAGAHGRWRG